MDAREAPRQPNFDTISDSFGALSQQFALCGNLPAVDSGARIHETLQAILQQNAQMNRKLTDLDRKVTDMDRKFTASIQNLDRKVTDLDRKVTDLDRKVTDLDRKVTDLDRKVTDLDRKVTDLDGKVTDLDGKVTDLDRKVTVIDLNCVRLRAPEVDRLLYHLGQSRAGSASAKKQRLIFASGSVWQERT
ncbi:hypothetical protein XA68_14314 [Ophiocordyceps unilateralis]|uniref:t-SNARE coiled-coil homology domain-containing protein n=1 Tax=Ophiocordyceps unilateralis TaxID=268505 RepID=A0A2A9PAV1_OPHUN|nr:hypothetical protein XA68_14314 [Ophiocordyceps unilateralis]